MDSSESSDKSDDEDDEDEDEEDEDEDPNEFDASMSYEFTKFMEDPTIREGQSKNTIINSDVAI